MYNVTGGNNCSLFVIWLNVQNSYKYEKTFPFLKIVRHYMASFKCYKGWQSNLWKMVLNLEFRQTMAKQPESFYFMKSHQRNRHLSSQFKQKGNSTENIYEAYSFLSHAGEFVTWHHTRGVQSVNTQKRRINYRACQRKNGSVLNRVYHYQMNSPNYKKCLCK
jgi:hypothetical protein